MALFSPFERAVFTLKINLTEIWLSVVVAARSDWTANFWCWSKKNNSMCNSAETAVSLTLIKLLWEFLFLKWFASKSPSAVQVGNFKDVFKHIVVWTSCLANGLLEACFGEVCNDIPADYLHIMWLLGYYHIVLAGKVRDGCIQPMARSILDLWQWNLHRTVVHAVALP